MVLYYKNIGKKFIYYRTVVKARISIKCKNLSLNTKLGVVKIKA